MDELLVDAPPDLSARDVEAAMLVQCVEVGNGARSIAADQREANVFWVASVVVESRFPAEAKRLLDVSSAYFRLHPAEKLQAGDVVKRGWVLGLPRLRDMLSQELEKARA